MRSIWLDEAISPHFKAVINIDNKWDVAGIRVKGTVRK